METMDAKDTIKMLEMNSPEKLDSSNSSNNSNGSVCCHDMSSYLSDSYLEIARDGAERESRKRKNGEWTEWSAEANVLLALLNERKERTNLPTPAKWISVKERLPEDGQTCIYVIHIPKKNEWKLDYGEWQAEESVFYGEYLDYRNLNWTLTHWMPLSAPPEGSL